MIIAGAIALVAGMLAGGSAAEANQKAANRASLLRMKAAVSESNQIQVQGAHQASLIFSNASKIRGREVAVQAASGIVPGVGSAQSVIDNTSNLASADAVVAVQDAYMKGSNVLQGAQYAVDSLQNAANAFSQQVKANDISHIATFANTYANSKGK